MKINDTQRKELERLWRIFGHDWPEANSRQPL